MRTIVEPQQHIAALWSKPEVRDGKTFRMMRYVMRVEHEGKVLLHNVVTGQLVVLDQDETKLVTLLPATYSSTMKALVDDHYLVAEQFDEHRLVVNVRTILRKLDAAKQKRFLTHYTIFPTTACNARCYYCFEQGVKPLTMTEEIANDVVSFITNYHGEDNAVSIMWFGGEPTVAANRIDQISKGLRRNGIRFTSTMISNAYLFDDNMVENAKTLWNLKRIQISVDGTGNIYNEIKDFVSAKENPYERVMHNVGLLLKNEIQVDLRMNFDLNNYKDFDNLMIEAIKRFTGSRYLNVYAYPVIGEYPDRKGTLLHGDAEWFAQTVISLNDKAREAGLYRYKNELPRLRYRGCGAESDHSITINAQGLLVECPEHFDMDEKVGSLTEGITNRSHIQAWKELADHKKCAQCIFFPRCVRLKRCSAGDNCYFQDRNQQYHEAVKRRFSAWNKKQVNSGGN